MSHLHECEGNASESREVLHALHERLFRAGELAAVDELLSDHFVWRQAALPQDPVPGRDGLRQFAAMLQTAIPDWQWDFERPLSQGDRSVLRWTLRGTHGGPLWDRGPTYHPLLVTGIHIARVRYGRIEELWQNWGLMSLLQQLGYLPIIGEQTVYPIWDYPEPGSVQPRPTPHAA